MVWYHHYSNHPHHHDPLHPTTGRYVITNTGYGILTNTTMKGRTLTNTGKTTNKHLQLNTITINTITTVPPATTSLLPLSPPLAPQYHCITTTLPNTSTITTTIPLLYNYYYLPTVTATKQVTPAFYVLSHTICVAKLLPGAMGTCAKSTRYTSPTPTAKLEL